MLKDNKCYCDYCGKEIVGRSKKVVQRAKRHFCNVSHRVLNTINKVEYKENYVIIYVNYGQKQGMCLVDIDDYENKIKPLGVKINMYVNGYCYFRFSGEKESNKKIKLHRYLMNCHEVQKPLIDHINRNPLDNRKINLRFTNGIINSYNKSVPKNNITNEKGVFFMKQRNRWHGMVQINGIRRHTKYTKTKEECSRLTRELRERMYKDYCEEMGLKEEYKTKVEVPLFVREENKKSKERNDKKGRKFGLLS